MRGLLSDETSSVTRRKGDLTMESRRQTRSDSRKQNSLEERRLTRGEKRKIMQGEPGAIEKTLKKRRDWDEQMKGKPRPVEESLKKKRARNEIMSKAAVSSAKITEERLSAASSPKSLSKSDNLQSINANTPITADPLQLDGKKDE